MKKYKMLVLTDHSRHSAENSLYALVKAMRVHPKCAQIDIASRGNEINNFFFHKKMAKGLFVSKAEEGFQFHPTGRTLTTKLRRELLRFYDVVWLSLIHI